MTDSLTRKAYGLLTGDEDARVCKDIPEEACREQPRNYLVHLGSLALTKTGDKFIDPKVTLAWLLAALGAPTAYVSLLVPVHSAFSLLPQLVVAGYLRRLPVRKWLWCAGSVGQGVALLGICLAAVNLTGGAAGIAVTLCLLLFSLCRGVCSVSHKDVLGKTVSKTRRGSVSGYADSFAGLIAIALASWLILGGGRSLTAVVLIIMAAALLWFVAAGIYSALVEERGATGGGSNAISEAGKQLSLLVVDAEFRHFVVSRTLLLGTALLPPYLVVLTPSLDNQALSGLGLLLLAASIAGFVSAPLWGRLADRSSRITMILGGACTGVTGLVTLALVGAGWTDELLLAICLFGVYVGHAGVRIGRKTHLVDMADAENRAAYVAVSNTVIGVALLLLAGFGALIDSLVDQGGLLFYSLMALVGAFMSLRLAEAQQ